MNGLGPVLVIVCVALIAGCVFLMHRMGRRSPLIETGLKAIDLLVPIPVGGDVLISGDAQSGIRVLGIELANRLMSHSRPTCHVVFYLDEAMADVESWVLEMQESLPSLTQRFVVPTVSTAEIQRQRSAAGRAHGVAIFAASRSERFLYDMQEAIRSVRESSTDATPVTSFAVTEELAPPGYDVTMRCSRLLAQKGIYPALDVGTSTSAASSHAMIKAKRRRVAESVRVAITGILQNLQPGPLAESEWVGGRSDDERTAVQAACFMSQLYFVAEPYTGKAGASIPLYKAVAAFEAIMTGKYRDVLPRKFLYLNDLNELDASSSS